MNTLITEQDNQKSEIQKSENQNEISAKDIFAEFTYWQFFYQQNKRINRACILKANDEQLKEKHKTNWKYFEAAAKYFNDNKNINYKLFIECTLKDNKQFYSAKVILLKPSLIKYQKKLDELDFAKEVSQAYNKIAKTIHFIVKDCKHHKIETWEQYKETRLIAGKSGFPSVFDEIMEGKISKYFLVFIKDFFTNILNTWTNDIRQHAELDDKNIKRVIKIARQAVYFKLSKHHINVDRVIEKLLKENKR